MHHKVYDEEESANEEDYYMYTHFLIYPYIGSRLEKLGLPGKEDCQSICISYFVNDNCVSTCQHTNPLPFEHNKKYEISDLTNYFVNNIQ